SPVTQRKATEQAARAPITAPAAFASCDGIHRSKNMAESTMSYKGPADGTQNKTLTYTATVTDADAPHFFEYYRSVYGNYWDATKNEVTPNPKDAEGNDNAVATDAQLFEAHAKGYADGIAAQVTRFNQV